MTLKIKPLVRPVKLTQREERSRAFRSAAKLCGTPSQHITIKTSKFPKEEKK